MKSARKTGSSVSGYAVAADGGWATGAGGRTDFRITIRPDGSGAPIDFEVDLGCGGAATTKHYRAMSNGYGYSVIGLG